MKEKKLVALTAWLGLSCLALAAARRGEAEDTMQEKIRAHRELRRPSNNTVAIRVGARAFTVDLYDNATARDLASKLPLTLKASDYPGYDEKVIRLQRPLSMTGAPRGDEPEIPEVGYYEPGRWVALYFGPIGYWPGKVPLGRIHATVDELRAIPDGAQVTIAAVSKSLSPSGALASAWFRGRLLSLR